MSFVDDWLNVCWLFNGRFGDICSDSMVVVLGWLVCIIIGCWFGIVLVGMVMVVLKLFCLLIMYGVVLSIVLLCSRVICWFGMNWWLVILVWVLGIIFLLWLLIWLWKLLVGVLNIGCVNVLLVVIDSVSVRVVRCGRELSLYMVVIFCWGCVFGVLL